MVRKYLLSVLSVAFLLSSSAVFAHETGKGHKHSKATMRALDRVERDVNRLESLLIGMRTNVVISDASWKRLANEANMLANRIFANVRAAKGDKDAIDTARQLRMHVRELHKEAHQGDGAEARLHASQALPFALRLDDWAS